MSARSQPRPRVAVVGLGALTSIGQSVEAIAAAVAGGISRFQPIESMRHPRTGEPTTMAPLSRVPAGSSAAACMTWLGARAAKQAILPLEQAAPNARVAALVSLPPARPGLSSPEIQAVARTLVEGLGVTVVRELSGLYDSGHDGGIAALDRAADILGRGLADFCLVGGVDTYREPDVIAWLSQAGRLKDDETPHGFIPGEGAAFALVTATSTARGLKLEERGRIIATGRAIEPSPWYTGRSTQARGLTEAIAGACAGLPPNTRADLTYCDANGEPWRADEWSFAYLRTARHHGDPIDLRHPADCWGDVGAASAILLLATALVDIARGRTRGPRALVWCASDTRPSRGAVLVEADPQEGVRWA